MKSLLTLAVITGLLLWYALAGRAWLKAKPWAQGFFAFVEPIEILLFRKSETILFARIKMVTGLLLTALTQIGQIDLSPIMPFVPDAYEPYVRVAVNFLPMVISLVGWADEILRKDTTKPLELVAVAEKDISPEVAQVIAAADEKKAEAVAVVTEAKAV